ncbi:hypothetical protein [Amycolatopsis keratiniphila]|uniref:Secreted protein n=1 Tax=Amycolatopsis keratiniphila subsp. keratiniphila TaxID=227715 RepID=A0A1W2LQ49_9PSEU|nr:hypothetical protein [Amycolatopsis keratiniphila]ONF66100.1 hypothetical protein AVR91_0224490 [Amycolatopsis keratiniphila subsp. keratiniphila]
MKKAFVRAVTGAALAGLVALGSAAPALAAQDTPNDVVVVDEPDTSDLNNIWTFAPLGVPVLGLIQSLNGVPGRLLPS